MNILGLLAVELGLNTASFKAGCDKGTYMAKVFAGQLKGEFSQLGSSFSQLGSQLGMSLGPLGGVISSLTKGLITMNGAVSAAGKGVPAMMALGAGIAGAGIAAVGAAIGMAELIKGGAEVVEQLNLLSVKTGISIQHLQTLKAAGEVVNIPIEQLAMGFRRFSRALSDSGDSTKRTTEVLKLLGVTSRDPYEAFLQLADGISKIEDPNRRAALATQLLGQRIAQGLLPELAKGRAGIEPFAAMVQQYGAEILPETVEAQEKLKKSQVQMGMSWDHLKVSAMGYSWVLKELNDEMSTALVHPFGKGMWGGEQKDPAADAKKKADADAAAAKAKTLHDGEDAAAAALTEYQNIKAGGVAAQTLMHAQEHIKDLLLENTAESNKQAGIEQAKIPFLEKQESLEKARREALLNLSKTTGAAVDEEAIKVTKAYAEAIKALGKDHAEETRELEVSATIQKFVNKQKEEGIYGTRAAKDALAQYTTAVNGASLATAELGKASEAGKLLYGFSERMKESTERSKLLSEATSTIERAQAEMAQSLDKATEALDAEKVAFDLLNADQTVDQETKNKAFALLAQHTQMLKADTDALDANREAIANKISDESITKENQALNRMTLYSDALSKQPEWLAKATSAAQEEADKIGLKGEKLKEFLDLKDREAHMEHNVVQPKEAAAKSLESGTPSAQNDAQNNIIAIKAMSAEYLKAGGSVTVLNKALGEANLKLLQMKAASGSTMAGVKAGFQQFINETKTVGQALQENIVKGLNGVSTGLAKTIVEGKSLGQSMRQVGKEMAESFIEMELKRVMAHMMAELHITGLTTLGATQRKAIEGQAAGASIRKSAGSAAGKAYDAMANIPYVGPILGAIAAAATFAGVMAFDSFDQGGIVGHTGLIKAHENEMVLPRPISEKVQKMADGGGPGNGKLPEIHQHNSYSSIDSKGMQEILTQHQSHIANGVVKELRRRNLI